MTAEQIRDLASMPLDQLLSTARQASRVGRQSAKSLIESRPVAASEALHMSNVIDVLVQKLQPMVAQDKNAERLHSALQDKVQPQADIPLDDAGLNK